MVVNKENLQELGFFANSDPLDGEYLLSLPNGLILVYYMPQNKLYIEQEYYPDDVDEEDVGHFLIYEDKERRLTVEQLTHLLNFLTFKTS